ncbi:MAG TPA: AAA family ATPase [Bdellovibrionota bacterium]|nr:AAA family ATPase [Bdellovibrionota bacterium]
MCERKSNLRIVGLTGRNASGKGEIARILREQGYVYRSLSDILREEATVRNLPASREILISLGKELREKEGPGTLAIRTLAHLSIGNYVIDSIRSPEEIRNLRDTGHFLLLGVDAPIEIRFQRATQRGRMENARTLQEFQEMENRERSDNPFSQQLDHCMEMVDELILNDTTLTDLKRKVRGILQKHRFPSN